MTDRSKAAARTPRLASRSRTGVRRARDGSSLLLRAQADVQRRRLAATHVDVRDVRSEAGLLDLDGVPPLGQLDDDPLLALRRSPLLAVDDDVGVARLNANRQRSE